MAGAHLDDVISHWHHLFEGMQLSPQDFYGQLEQAIKGRNIPDARFSRVDIKEGGLLSAKRVYLRVWRKEHIFDICGAPFGNGFFVSWWLCSPPSGCLAALLSFPVLNRLTWLLARPVTYYKIDVALMFQESVRRAVNEVLDQVTSVQGTRALSEEERKPIMREFYKS